MSLSAHRTDKQVRISTDKNNINFNIYCNDNVWFIMNEQLTKKQNFCWHCTAFYRDTKHPPRTFVSGRDLKICKTPVMLFFFFKEILVRGGGGAHDDCRYLWDPAQHLCCLLLHQAEVTENISQVGS